MNDQNEYAFRNLQLEMARRSPRGAMAFIVGAIVLALYPLGAITYPKLIVKIACIVPFANIMRIYFSKKILKDEINLNLTYVNLHRVAIILNAFLLGVALSLPLADHNKTLIYTFAILCPILAGGPASIAFDKITIYGVIGLLGGLPLATLIFLTFKSDSNLFTVTAAMFLELIFMFAICFDFYKRLTDTYKKDIELKNTQKIMEEQKAKAEQSAKLATLGEMAGGIAHEINTPLGAIQLNAQFLNDIIDENFQTKIKEPEKIKESLKNRTNSIIKTSERIAKIIKGLRIFARDADQDPRTLVPIKKIIDDTLALCYEKFRDLGLELNLIQSDENISVYAQETQLCQVILNLLNNSSDALVDKSEKWIDIEVISTSDVCEIRITDSGCGLSQEVQNKLFQPFFTTKDVGKGTGLGLSISKGIIEDHLGHLLYDKKSKNTCFVIQLPVSTEVSKKVA